MFYGHAMLIGGKPERIEIFIVSGLLLSRPVDTKTDLKLNNIIATPSSNLILTPLDECQSWWASTIRDMRPWRYNLCALRLVRCKLPLRHWNLGNLTLQQECYLTTGMLPYKHSSSLLRRHSLGSSRNLRGGGRLRDEPKECLRRRLTFLSSTRDFYRLHSTFARLYNAAASPASRLRSAGSLAIKLMHVTLYRWFDRLFGSWIINAFWSSLIESLTMTFTVDGKRQRVPLIFYSFHFILK